MGFPGVKTVFDEAKVSQDIKDCKGRLYLICEKQSCGFVCMKNYIYSVPALKKQLDESRLVGDNKMVHNAMAILEKALEKSDGDMSSALKSAFFILNNKGREMGFMPPNTQVNINNEKISPEQIVEAIDDSKQA